MLASHLNQKLFDADVEKVPNRNGYGDGLLEAGKKDERVIALCADLTESTKTDIFAKAFPERFIEMGIGEQSMASVASGMAAFGKIPFIASYAMFSPGRSWEQVRTTIAYNNANVKIIGAHSGISVGPDGATHQAIEDVAIMRVIPRMTVVAPVDAIEAKKATHAAAEHVGPVYIRLAREATPIITTPDSPFAFGKAEVYYTPESKKRIGLISSGPIMYHALKAAHELDQEGVGVSVLSLAAIKPLDNEGVIAFAKEHEALVTLEEHQVFGGVGSAVAECLAEHHPMRIAFLGVKDRFGQSGTMEELLAHYEMDSEAVKKTVHALL